MRLVVANFKMNLLQDDITGYIKDLKSVNGSNIVICPPNIYIKQFVEEGYLTGGQDMAFDNFGAYTGDVSIKQLKELGVTYSIIGHSERRKYYHDDIYVNRKVTLALENDIIPIICIGESKESREENNIEKILKEEIDEALKNVNSSNIIFAYEPLWSIGTGLIPTNEIIYETINFIKKYVKENYKLDVKVLYGGSVNTENISHLEEVKNIDGYLVGGCSIVVSKFMQLIKCINKD